MAHGGGRRDLAAEAWVRDIGEAKWAAMKELEPRSPG